MAAHRRRLRGIAVTARTISDLAFLVALALLTVGSGMLVGSTGVLRALGRAQPQAAGRSEEQGPRRRLARRLLAAGGGLLAVAVVTAWYAQ
ncbi:MAG: hypothetical protein VB036_04965 [Propionicimonas sp.]|nr:hypothetical protein [Propionicimonas sp.]